MIETLEQFNVAYRRLKESPKGEWFRHREVPLAKTDDWSSTALATEFAPYSRREIRFTSEDELARKLMIGKSRNEKDLLCALLMDLGLLSPDFPTESSIEQ